MRSPDNIEWLAPWRPVSPSEAQSLEAELAREVGEQHPLHGRTARAIGKRDDMDDVAFRLEDDLPRVAVVHLRGTGKMEKDPHWPHTVIFASLEEWVEKEMKPDHDADEAVI